MADDGELYNKPAHAVPLASARQHPEIQKENQAGHSSGRVVEGHFRAGKLDWFQWHIGRGGGVNFFAASVSKKRYSRHEHTTFQVTRLGQKEKQNKKGNKKRTRFVVSLTKK